MKVPTSFKLFGNTIKVIHTPSLSFYKNAIGEARFLTEKVMLQTSNNGFPISEKKMEQVFCHELVHHLLRSMGREKLNDDEVFVDLFGCLLHQALDTAKYVKNS